MQEVHTEQRYCSKGKATWLATSYLFQPRRHPQSICSFARVRRTPSPLELLAYKHQERRSIAFQPVWEEDLGGFSVVIMATLQNLSQVFC